MGENGMQVTSNYSQAMGFAIKHAGEGQASLHCELQERHMNTRGVCHGGVISGLMDMAAGVATKSRCDASQTIATVSLTVNYERPARLGDILLAQAQVRSGRRVISCEILVRTQAGTPIATGVATLVVR